METVFAWNIIDEHVFSKDVQFSFGEKEASKVLDNWNSVYEDLLINVVVSLKEGIPDLDSYFFPGETYGMVFSWKGDNRFSGSTPIMEFHPDHPFELSFKIDKGSCGASFSAECNLIVSMPAIDEDGEWYRPPGSIVASIPIIEKTTIQRGTWFPVEEYEGDGNVLVHWDFANTEELDLSLSSCLLVLVDKKHPLASVLSSATEGQSLLTLIIVQGFARKLFVSNVFDQLKTKFENNEQWSSGSLGASFDYVLRKLYSDLKVTSVDMIRNIFKENPERIDESIDNIFSKSFLTTLNK